MIMRPAKPTSSPMRALSAVILTSVIGISLGACASVQNTTSVAAAAVTDAGKPLQTSQVDAVLGVGITVRDLDASIAFYRDVLSFRLVEQREETGDGVEALTGIFGVRRRIAVMQLGEERIELTDYLAPEGQPVPTDFRSNDRWFQHLAIVVADMDRAYAHLRAHNVRHASTGPQTLPLNNPNAGGIRAFYFKDPDGHPLEAIWFPEGKGDPRWRQSTMQHPAQLFLGIDHTAIVVANTGTALNFYRDTLGLRVAGESDNLGIEQSRLNNVRGAHLRITGLRAAHGMGIELLEYLQPGPGRPYPATAAPNDLIHYETLVQTKSAEQAATITARPTTPADPDADGPQPKQVMLRDPDGHALVARQATPPF